MKKLLVAIAFLGFIACKSKNVTPVQVKTNDDSLQVKTNDDSLKVETKEDSMKIDQAPKEEAPTQGNQ